LVSQIHSLDQSQGQAEGAEPRVEVLRRAPLVGLRHFTYPYEAALAVCSDLDETPDGGVYLEIARYLNTREMTAMGPGVGLEVGNSIYFDMPRGQFAYWTTDDASRAMIRDLIASGHIDVLHSYGDLARTREDAVKSIDELQRHNCRLEVWVDHSKAPTNFGPDIMVGSGDVPGSESYHADLTLAYGIRYVWRGRTTGIIGQDAPIRPSSLGHLFDVRHPLASARVAAKEAVKIGLGSGGHARWKMYAANRVCRANFLRDGQPVWEFLRSNPYWGGSGLGDTADGINEVLTPRMLETLIGRQGTCILYTHLGKVRNPRCPFGIGAQRTFERVAELAQDRRLLVRTTRRLLGFIVARDHLVYDAELRGETLVITIETIDDPVTGRRVPQTSELQGLSFVGPPCGSIRVELSGGTAIPIEVASRDGRSVATIPWQRLEFPR
jgi:hypothetical protein